MTDVSVDSVDGALAVVDDHVELRDASRGARDLLLALPALLATAPPGASILTWLRLEPAEDADWTLVARLHEASHDPASSDAHDALRHPERLVVATLAIAAAGSNHDALTTSRQLARTLGLGRPDEQEAALLVGERQLLGAAARSRDAFSESRVLQLASHVEEPERARELYLLGLATEPDDATRTRLHGLHDLLQEHLDRSDDATSVRIADRRRAEAKALVADRAGDRIDHAPQPYLLATPAAIVAEHAELAAALTWRETVRVRVAEDPQPWHWRVDLAAADRDALLAAVTLALHEAGLEIVSAQVATWSDGVGVESFRVKSQRVPSMGELHDAVAARLDGSFTSAPLEDACADFDHESSPWFTVCHVEVADQPGLLHALAVDLAAAGARIHAAEVSTADGIAIDRFELTDRRGAKLDAATCERIVAAIRDGATVPDRRGLVGRLRSRRARPAS